MTIEWQRLEDEELRADEKSVAIAALELQGHSVVGSGYDLEEK